MSKKPSEIFRERLQKRADNALSKKQTPSPSERNSTKMRKRLARGAPVVATLQHDCRGCGRSDCEKSMNTCGEKIVIDRCKLCGTNVMFRFVFGEPYYCPICVERRKR